MDLVCTIFGPPNLHSFCITVTHTQTTTLTRAFLIEQGSALSKCAAKLSQELALEMRFIFVYQ
jgi:hypothetical protein